MSASLPKLARAIALTEGATAAMSYVRAETMQISNRQDRAVARFNGYAAIPDEAFAFYAVQQAKRACEMERKTR
jgi:hypothetical protein